MKVIRSIQEWQAIRANRDEGSLGFVPTLGGLHEGHQALLKRSVEENQQTALSIFLNKTQFNDPKDLESYPSVEKDDLKLAERCGVDFVFIPSYDDIYPDGYQFRVVSEHPFSKVMEGANRPGHFEGVLTVVLKLLLITKATRAYFGEKDYQQLVLVGEMAKAFFLETDIIACATVRDNDGLPYSSRHKRLNHGEMLVARKFAKILQVHQGVENVERTLVNETIPFDYVDVYRNRLFAAARVGCVRLIDNVPLKTGTEGDR